MMIDQPDLRARQILQNITENRRRPDQTDQTDHDRRSYWALKMDEADAFMRRIMTYPVAECGESMLSLESAVHSDGVEVAFSDKPHIDGLPRLFYLRRSLVPQFLSAAREMNERGWILKVEDGYRTLAMQRGPRTAGADIPDGVKQSSLGMRAGRAAGRFAVPPAGGACGERPQSRHAYVGQRHGYLGSAAGFRRGSRSWRAIYRIVRADAHGFAFYLRGGAG